MNTQSGIEWVWGVLSLEVGAALAVALVIWLAWDKKTRGYRHSEMMKQLTRLQQLNLEEFIREGLQCRVLRKVGYWTWMGGRNSYVITRRYLRLPESGLVAQTLSSVLKWHTAHSDETTSEGNKVPYLREAIDANYKQLRRHCSRGRMLRIIEQTKGEWIIQARLMANWKGRKHQQPAEAAE